MMNNPNTQLVNIDKSLLSELCQLNTLRVLSRIILILFVYGICSVIVTMPNFILFAFILCPFMGFILAGFLNAAHECVHYTHFRSKKTNRIIGILWCAPILMNYTVYRYQHLAHHRFTGVAGDTESHQIYPSLRSYFIAFTGIAYWRHVIGLAVKPARGIYAKSISNSKRRKEVIQDNYILVFWLIMVIVLTTIFPRILLLVYWLPLICYAPISLFLSLPEHYGCLDDYEVLGNTRTVISNRFTRLFIWNANYHADHHAYPFIPAANLTALHKELAPQIFRVEKSYLRFHWRLIKTLAQKSTKGN